MNFEHRKDVDLSKRYVYVIYFSDSSAYVGLSYSPKKRLLSHLNSSSRIAEKLREPNLSWALSVEDGPLDIKDASKAESDKIKSLKESKLFLLNISKGGEIGTRVHKWNLDALAAEASKYKTRNEFKTNSPHLYVMACKRKVLSDVQSNLPPPKTRPAGYWTKERIIEEAKKHKTRTDFKLNAAGAYEAALHLGMLDDLIVSVCGNHKHTVESILDSTNGYNSLARWRFDHEQKYKSALRKGIIHLVKEHFKA